MTRRSHHFTIRRLYLDGRNREELPSPTVNGRHIRFADNDVTNEHTAICFALGHQRFGVARRVTIQRNRIHDCGTLPATNLEQGVYVAIARDTRLVGNWIYANADQGVQLYPDARRTYIAGNVIDGNGEGIIFGGSPWTAASDNLVVGNVISNSRLRENVESHFDGPIGTGNVIRGNCIGGGVRDAGMGGILSPAVGFEAAANLLGGAGLQGRGVGGLPAGAGQPLRQALPRLAPGRSRSGPRATALRLSSRTTGHSASSSQSCLLYWRETKKSAASSPISATNSARARMSSWRSPLRSASRAARTVHASEKAITLRKRTRPTMPSSASTSR